jgi:hypothetical protein
MKLTAADLVQLPCRDLVVELNQPVAIAGEELQE